MHLSRRDMLRGGLGAGLTAYTGLWLLGCNDAASTASLPDVPWPHIANRPDTGAAVPSAAPAGTPQASTGSASILDRVLARDKWTASRTIRSRANAMAGVKRITIHHEGATNSPVHFADIAATRARLESIRRSHLARGWADIGYHYVIDRAGRVWQARPIWFQGAHVKNQNEHNVGVMVLGNFDIQSPSSAQMTTLPDLVAALRRKYAVTQALVKTHQEWNPTNCPGRALQPRVVAMRSRGAFV